MKQKLAYLHYGRTLTDTRRFQRYLRRKLLYNNYNYRLETMQVTVGVS